MLLQCPGALLLARDSRFCWWNDSSPLSPGTTVPIVGIFAFSLRIHSPAVSTLRHVLLAGIRISAFASQTAQPPSQQPPTLLWTR